MLSAHLHYLAMLERVRCIESPIQPILGHQRAEFIQRGWVTQDGYLTHVMVPFLDSEQEVEVEIDEDNRVYRYRSPQHHKRIVEQPLTDITRYALQIDVWLDNLATLIGIEPRHRSQRPIRIPCHLWHLGNARIAGTHQFAPVFVAHLLEKAPKTEVTTVLCDPIWSHGGVLLRHHPAITKLPRDHVMRGLCDFVCVNKAGQHVFDASAFARVLRGFVTASGTPEPLQFLQGNRLKLPHFNESRELSPERAKIIKLMWGAEGKSPPEMSWTEVNAKANTGYQSFDDAFGGTTLRKDVIEKIRWAKYRVRRNP
jgi:hypothetical protein